MELLTELIERSPRDPKWLEARGQVFIDAKDFLAALNDYNLAIQLTPKSLGADMARLISGRALAYEGMSRWEDALGDYDTAMDLAERAGYQ